MGKRDKRVAFMNPIAAARARGPAPTSGPTIKDYLGRNRMSLEEAEEKIIKSTKKGGSDSLAAWEQELNDNYRKELKKAREKKLAGAALSLKKKKKKKAKKRAKSRSRSRSPSLSDSDDDADRKRKRRRKEKTRKKRKHRQSSSETDSDTPSDESEEESDRELSHRQKMASLSAKDEVESGVPSEPLASQAELGEETGRKVLLPTPAAPGPPRSEHRPTKWTSKWDSQEPT